MRSKDLAFMIILIISGDLYAEEQGCGLPRVENGRIAVYYYTFESHYFPMSVGQTLTFSCLAGYTTDKGKQEEKTTCTAVGWAPLPGCFKKCARPVLLNGQISDPKVLYAIHESLRYSCASGFTTATGKQEEEVRCLVGGWSSPPACRKEQDSCSTPELHHGNYSTTQTTFRLQEKVRYQCDPGYYTAGGGTSEEAECRKHGWTPPPACTKLKCPLLRLTEKSYWQPLKLTYEEGDVVQFFCHENYYLNGPDLIQCYSFGWFPEPPVCEVRRSRCPPPPLPLNSAIQTNATTYRHGETVRVQCELNFEVQGPQEIHCNNGKWTKPPKCVEEKEKVTCEDPPRVENGVAAALSSQTFRSGDRVSYSCRSGYFLLGPKDISCKRGRWTQPPQCVEILESCRPPPDVLNGAIVGEVLASYPEGSTVEYRCNEYYILQGPQRSGCEDGQWSPQPVCLEPCTINEDIMNRNNIELKWKYTGKVLHGDLVDFVCKQGFGLSPSTPPSELSAQCKGGEVKYPLCIKTESKASCVPPSLIENALIVNLSSKPYDSGSSVEYRCFQYFVLQGSKDSYCIEGAWTPPPVCVEPCVLSLDEMNKNNLYLKWTFDNRPVIYHGEYVEFLCRRDEFLSEMNLVEGELRVRCDAGELKYPRCSPRYRMRYYTQS